MALRGGSAVDHFAILPPSAFGTCRACVGRFYFLPVGANARGERHDRDRSGANSHRSWA